jgi:hypothetical protein
VKGGDLEKGGVWRGKCQEILQDERNFDEGNFDEKSFGGFAA